MNISHHHSGNPVFAWRYSISATVYLPLSHDHFPFVVCSEFLLPTRFITFPPQFQVPLTSLPHPASPPQFCPTKMTSVRIVMHTTSPVEAKIGNAQMSDQLTKPLKPIIDHVYNESHSHHFFESRPSQHHQEECAGYHESYTYYWSRI